MMEAINSYLHIEDDKEISDNSIPKILIQTNPAFQSISILLLRCTIGIILFITGAGKLFGWFGGFGLDLTLQFYTKMGISIPFAYLSIYTEFIGGFLLTVGLLTRPASLAVMINMLVATIISLPGGFLSPNGASYPFIFFIIDIAIFIASPMKYSIDYLVLRRRHELQ